MMDLVNLGFVKLSHNIKTPTKTTQFSIGLDRVGVHKLRIWFN